jgi:uncharacterized protein (TIGR01244 family)
MAGSVAGAVAKVSFAPDVVNEAAGAPREVERGTPMTDFRKVTDTYTVSPQISTADIAAAAGQGYVLVINNRPDGETPDQPDSATMEAAARAAGLDYLYNPVRGGPSPDNVAAQTEAVANAKGPVLAFCRSGTRSIVTWSLGQAQSGARPRDELVRLGAAAGYDLAPILGG